jgi:hypothetical protein
VLYGAAVAAVLAVLSVGVYSRLSEIDAPIAPAQVAEVSPRPAPAAAISVVDVPSPSPAALVTVSPILAIWRGIA